MSTIYESLPPQVAGEVLGYLRLSSKVILRDGSSPVNYTVRWEWWGHQGVTVNLNVPWKAGSVPEEAVFPLRASLKSVHEYLRDMKEMKMELLNAKRQRVGRSILPLKKIVEGGSKATETIKILGVGKASKQTVGEMTLNVSTAYEGGKADVNDESFTDETMVPPTVSGGTPERLDLAKTSTHSSGKSNSAVVSSFQMNEAKAFTDSSGKLSEWPASEQDMAVIGGEQKEQQDRGQGRASYAVTFHPTESLPSAAGNTSSSNGGGGGGQKVKSSSGSGVGKASPSTNGRKPVRSSSRRGSISPPARAQTEKLGDSAGPVAAPVAEEKPTGTSVDALLSRAEGLLAMVAGANLATAAAKAPVASAPAPSVPESAPTSSSKGRVGRGRSPPGKGQKRSPSPAERKAAKAAAAAAQEEKEREERARERAIITGANVKPLVGQPLAGFPGQRMFEVPVSMLPSESTGERLRLQAADPSSEMTQIEWLLRDMPEAYGENQIDDDEVQALLDEGGEPPSALKYPSMYAANQRVMNKLQFMRSLEVDLSHLIIYSARFGIRKENSHFVIKAPSGCKVTRVKAARGSSESDKVLPDSRVVPLNELVEDLDAVSYSEPAAGQGNRPSGNVPSARDVAQKGILKEFFVGGMDLSKHESFELELNDRTLREWIKGDRGAGDSLGGGGGCLRIEIWSYVVNPDGFRAGRNVRPPESTLFGSVDIPLGGLLGTDALDVSTTAELEVNVSNHTNVTNKMRSMPYGHHLVRSKPLGPQLGSVTVRLALKPDASTYSHVYPEHKSAQDLNEASDGTAYAGQVDDEGFNRGTYGLSKGAIGRSAAAAGTVAYTKEEEKLRKGGRKQSASSSLSVYTPLMMPQPSDEVQAIRHHEIIEVPDAVGEALKYMPEEAPRKGDLPVPRRLSDPQRMKTGVQSALAVTVYSLASSRLPYETEPDDERAELRVSYKITKSQSAHLPNIYLTRGAASYSTTEHMEPLCRVFEVPDMGLWVPPVFEIWLVRKKPQSPTSSTDATTSSGDALGPSHSVLLGLASFSKHDNIGDIVQLEVLDSFSGEAVGVMEASLHLHESRAYVEEQAGKKVGFYLSNRYKGLEVSTPVGSSLQKEKLKNWHMPGATTTDSTRQISKSFVRSPARSYAAAARGASKSVAVADSDLSADSLEVSHTLETSLTRTAGLETSREEEELLEELFYGSGRTKSALRASVEASATATSSHRNSSGDQQTSSKKSELRDAIEMAARDEDARGSPNISELRRSVEFEGAQRQGDKSPSPEQETGLGVSCASTGAPKSPSVDLDMRDRKLRRELRQVEPLAVENSEEENEGEDVGRDEDVPSENPPGAATPEFMVPPGAASQTEQLKISSPPEDPVMGVPVPMGSTPVVWKEKATGMSFSTGEDGPVSIASPTAEEVVGAAEGLLSVKPRLVTQRNRRVRDRRHTQAKNRHILDLTINGVCCEAGEAATADDIAALGVPFGCFVVCSLLLPDNKRLGETSEPDAQVLIKPVASLWWDAEYPVLNGRSRATFHSDEHSLAEGLFEEGNDLELLVYARDETGGLTMQSGRLVGTASLPSGRLNALVNSAGSNITTHLPLSWSAVGAYSEKVVSTVELSLSHRVEPLLITTSASVIGSGEAESSIASSAASSPRASRSDLPWQAPPNHLPLRVAILELAHIPNAVFVTDNSPASPPTTPSAAKVVLSAIALGRTPTAIQPELGAYLPESSSFVSSTLSVPLAPLGWE